MEKYQAVEDRAVATKLIEGGHLFLCAMESESTLGLMYYVFLNSPSLQTSLSKLERSVGSCAR